MKRGKQDQFEKNGHSSCGCGVNVCSFHTQWAQRDREVQETAGLCLCLRMKLQGKALCSVKVPSSNS